jgi:hypothetical protein
MLEVIGVFQGHFLIRGWVVTGQDHPASAALARTVRGDFTTLLDRIELPLMSLVARLYLGV